MNDDLPQLPGGRRPWRTDEQWSRLRERIDAAEPVPVQSRWSVRWLAAAAAAVLVVAGIRWAVVYSDSEARSVTTAVGERIVLQLADGSRVTVGPATTVRYRLGRTRRDIDVDGLAAFDVVHNAARPFVVRAKNAIATDLGTRFVVRAYAADSGVEVAVTSGAVTLSGSAQSPALELRAGSVGHVGSTGEPDARPPARAASDTAWIDGRLAFDDQRLGDVAAELERWFDVQIRIPDAALANRRVSAVYNAPTLAGVLEALTTTFGARTERVGRVVTLSPSSR